jgi:hypothetical protein
MIKKILLLPIIVLLFGCILSSSADANPRTRVDKTKMSINALDDKTTFPLRYYVGPGINLEGSKQGYDYVIGPEIPTALTGFYDWQTNGDCKHYLYYVSSSIVHAIYMTSPDSATPSPSRVTSYAFSTDGGSTWSFIANAPNGIRSGYGTLTIGTSGAMTNAAIIGNHYVLTPNPLSSGMHIDAFPGLGSFTTTFWNFNMTSFIWPQVSTLTDGNILVAGNTYHSALATDTGLVTRFNPVTNQWIGNPQFFNPPASSLENMRWATATGPNGAAVYAISALADLGGPFGGNRVFYYTSSDNGVTWSSQNTLFESYVDSVDNDTVTAWLGIDAIYDNNGDFYVVYNTIGNLFTSAKIWVSKNGSPGVLVAANSQIPGAASSLIVSLQNGITMDWPSLALSDDDQYIFCSYSVCKQNDTLNGFNSYDLYYSVSPTGTLNFQIPDQPVQITSGIDDERYVSLNRSAFTDGINTYKLPMVYQKDPQPGSSAFGDNAPISRATLIYREITRAQVINIKNISGEIPIDYSLAQNYPNPFNPSTTIRFAIPEQSKVTLKIYDINGREIATLINNETVSIGIKEINFDANSLSSGIYFYTIRASDFIATKKMLFVK